MTIGIRKEVAAPAKSSTERGCFRANIPLDQPIGPLTALRDCSCRSSGRQAGGQQPRPVTTSRLAMLILPASEVKSTEGKSRWPDLTSFLRRHVAAAARR